MKKMKIILLIIGSYCCFLLPITNVWAIVTEGNLEYYDESNSSESQESSETADSKTNSKTNSKSVGPKTTDPKVSNPKQSNPKRSSSNVATKSATNGSFSKFNDSNNNILFILGIMCMLIAFYIFQNKRTRWKKMKKVKYVLLSSLVVSALAVPSMVFADEGGHEPIHPQARNTDGEVAYESGGIHFDPHLKIPKKLNFGKHQIRNGHEENLLAREGGTGPITRGSVDVEDNRGSDGGWEVKLRQEEQFSFGTHELRGARLSIEEGTITNNTGSTIIGGDRILNLTPRMTESVMKAAHDEGAGDTEMPLHEFRLHVPAETERKVGLYKTDLNWTLSTTP